MYERVQPSSLPSSMYEGGFANSSGVVKLALEHFGIAPPAVLYYPGSATDVSLVGIKDLHVIHADNVLDEQMLGGFGLLGAEAHEVDVHDWRPDLSVDAVAFINPTSIDEEQVLEHTDLREGGLVLWAFWSGRPTALQDAEALSLVGVINYDEDGSFFIDTDDLSDYFAYKDFDHLSEEEREDFVTKLEQYLARHDELTVQLSPQELYQALLVSEDPRDELHLTNMNYGFPYKKDGTFYVFEKQTQL